MRSLLLLTIFSISSHLWAGDASPSLPGLVWAGDVRPTPAGLAGRALILICCVGSDGKQNGNFGPFLTQLDAAIGGDLRVQPVLVASGGYAPKVGDRWLRADDADREAVRALAENSGPWRYVLVGADGNVVESGDAYQYRKRPDGFEFKLPKLPQLKQLMDQGVPPFDTGTLTPTPGVAAAIKLAERGDLAGALAGAAKAGAEGQPLIQALVASRLQVVERAAQALHTPALGNKRWPALRQVEAIAAEMAGSGAGKRAQEVLAEIKKDKALTEAMARERQAQEAWDRLQAGLRSAGGKRAEMRDQGLGVLVGAFADTWIGGFAARAKAQP